MSSLKKLCAGILLALTVACGGQTVTGPEQPTSVTSGGATEQNAAPTPPVTAPPPSTGPEHNAKVKNGFYSITNETGMAQFYCAAAFGILPNGDQGLHTNLFQDQGVRQSKDVFSGQAPLKAACQYDRIQVDLTQSKDCKNFDWTNVLAAEVYKNPSYIEGSKKSKLEALAYGEWTEYGPWSGQECGTRTRTRKVYEQYKYECSGEVVRVEVRTETDTETRSCCTYSEATFSATNFREEDRDERWYVTDTWVKGGASVQGAATWKFEIYAASSTSEYNNNDPDYVKASSEKVLDCNGKHTFSLEYHSNGHGSDVWWAALYRNGVRVWKSEPEYN